MQLPAEAAIRISSTQIPPAALHCDPEHYTLAPSRLVSPPAAFVAAARSHSERHQTELLAALRHCHRLLFWLRQQDAAALAAGLLAAEAAGAVGLYCCEQPPGQPAAAVLVPATARADADAAVWWCSTAAEESGLVAVPEPPFRGPMLPAVSLLPVQIASSQGWHLRCPAAVVDDGNFPGMLAALQLSESEPVRAHSESVRAHRNSHVQIQPLLASQHIGTSCIHQCTTHEHVSKHTAMILQQ